MNNYTNLGRQMSNKQHLETSLEGKCFVVTNEFIVESLGNNHSIRMCKGDVFVVVSSVTDEEYQCQNVVIITVLGTGKMYADLSKRENPWPNYTTIVCRSDV